MNNNNDLLSIFSIGLAIYGLTRNKEETPLSNYDLAVQNGYTGTLAQYLASLKGAQGERGLPGKDAFSGFVNVRDFGATGDGITDDTVAINQAMNTNKHIYFPAGHYLTSGINVTRNNRTVRGDGNDSVIIIASGSYRPALLADGLINVLIENLKIDGNADGNPLDSSGYNVGGEDIGVKRTTGAVLVRNSSHVVVRNVNVENAFSAPVVLEDCRHSVIEYCNSANHRREGLGLEGGYKCVIQYCNSWGDFPFLSLSEPAPWSNYFTRGIEGETDVKHEHIIRYNQARNSRAAHITINTNSTELYGCSVLNDTEADIIKRIGIRLGHDDSVSIYARAYNCKVYNNIIDGIYTTDSSVPTTEQRGIQAGNAIGSEIFNNTIIRCRDGIGAGSTPAQKLKIERNKIYNSVENGIFMHDGAPESCIVNDNFIETAAAGIRISTGVRLSVFNNVIEKVGTGIRANDCNNCLFEGNEVNESTEYGIRVYVSNSTSANNIIRQNTVKSMISGQAYQIGNLAGNVVQLNITENQTPGIELVSRKQVTAVNTLPEGLSNFYVASGGVANGFPTDAGQGIFSRGGGESSSFSLFKSSASGNNNLYFQPGYSGAWLRVINESDIPEVVVNNAVTEPSKADLNTVYGSEKQKFVAVYPDITGGGKQFIKLSNSASSDWIVSEITIVS